MSIYHFIFSCYYTAQNFKGIVVVIWKPRDILDKNENLTFFLLAYKKLSTKVSWKICIIITIWHCHSIPSNSATSNEFLDDVYYSRHLGQNMSLFIRFVWTFLELYPFPCLMIKARIAGSIFIHFCERHVIKNTYSIYRILTNVISNFFIKVYCKVM